MISFREESLHYFKKDLFTEASLNFVIIHPFFPRLYLLSLQELFPLRNFMQITFPLNYPKFVMIILKKLMNLNLIFDFIHFPNPIFENYYLNFNHQYPTVLLHHNNYFDDHFEYLYYPFTNHHIQAGYAQSFHISCLPNTHCYNKNYHY